MKKIGTALSGAILVEMSEEQFEAISKLSSSTIPHPNQSSELSSTMSFNDKVNFVQPKLIKLAPKKQSALLNSVKNMFNFTGGIDDSEAEKIITRLKQKGVINISKTNKVEYQEV
jgi:hypothetical protein